MADPIVFWRDGYVSGRGGCFVRAQSVNETITKFVQEGIEVAGIVIDPAHETNVELIIAETDAPGA